MKGFEVLDLLGFMIEGGVKPMELRRVLLMGLMTGRHYYRQVGASGP